MKELELNVNEILEDCPQNESELKEEDTECVINLADDEELYGKFSYCKCKCEFYNKCLSNKEFCVKSLFAQVLKTLTPREEHIIRSFYMVNCKSKENIDDLSKYWNISCELIVEIKDKALRKLRHPSRSRMLNSVDMCWILLSCNETSYFTLWKDIFMETRPKETLYMFFLERYCNEKKKEIEKIQQQIDRAEWQKKKINAQHNITDDTTITDCCFGDKYDGETFECELKVGEIRHWTGGEVYRLCNYNKILFEEIVNVLFSNNIYFPDYPSNANVEIYLEKVYSEYSSKRRKEALAIPIEELGFSVRTFNCLRRAGIVIVEDLILRTEDEVKQIRNMGNKSLEEIKERLTSFELCLLGSNFPSHNLSSSSIEYRKNKILEIPIEDLEFSSRTFTCLKRAGIDTIGDISRLSEYDLMHVRNLGKMNLDEIIQKLNGFGVSLAEEEE